MTSTTPPPAPVVVGVDDLRDCHAALSFAAVEADLSRSALTLVHVSDDEAARDSRHHSDCLARSRRTRTSAQKTENGTWLSSKNWVAEYQRIKHKRAKSKAAR